MLNKIMRTAIHITKVNTHQTATASMSKEKSNTNTANVQCVTDNLWRAQNAHEESANTNSHIPHRQAMCSERHDHERNAQNANDNVQHIN